MSTSSDLLFCVVML